MVPLFYGYFYLKSLTFRIMSGGRIVGILRYLSYRDVKIPPKELRKTYFEDIQSQLKQSNEACPEVDVYKIFSDMMHRYGKYQKGIGSW